MSGKILSQSGNSLADTYDVAGSVAGLDRLITDELPIVHEMGGTIFSERLGGEIRRMTSTALAQNLAWDVVDTTLPVMPMRILGVSVFATLGGRVDDVVLCIRDGGAAREIPIFGWDLNEDFMSVRLEDDGGGVTNQDLLVSNLNLPAMGPSMLIGRDQRLDVDQLSFRGLTTAFGAGAVTVVALVYLAFPQQVGALSSRGLPIPSW